MSPPNPLPLTYVSYSFVCVSTLLRIQSPVLVLVEQLGQDVVSISDHTITVQIETYVRFHLTSPLLKQLSLG